MDICQQYEIKDFSMKVLHSKSKVMKRELTIFTTGNNSSPFYKHGVSHSINYNRVRADLNIFLNLFREYSNFEGLDAAEGREMKKKGTDIHFSCSVSI